MWVSIGLLGSPNHPQSIQDHPTQTFCFNSQAAYHSYHTSSLLLHLFMENIFVSNSFFIRPWSVDVDVDVDVGVGDEIAVDVDVMLV